MPIGLPPWLHVILETSRIGESGVPVYTLYITCVQWSITTLFIVAL